MRKFIDGNGADSTSAVQTYLTTHRELLFADLYIITTAPNYVGQFLGQSFFLTSYGAPLVWSYKGTFLPASIKRGGVSSKIGTEADTLDLEWNPGVKDILAFDTDNVTTLLTVFQGFCKGVFDNGQVDVWRCLMPTNGDANTFGACLLFRGRIGDTDINIDTIKSKLFSRMETLNQQIPTNLIEPTNLFAEYSVGTVPTGFPTTFQVEANSTINKIFTSPVSPPAGFTPASDIYNSGYLVVQTGRLAGTYRAIFKQGIESGFHTFYLYEPLPFQIIAGDQISPFVPTPRDFGVASPFAGFPFVPQPINSSVII